jgi:hypothetical protein
VVKFIIAAADSRQRHHHSSSSSHRWNCVAPHRSVQSSWWQQRQHPSWGARGPAAPASGGKSAISARVRGQTRPWADWSVVCCCCSCCRVHGLSCVLAAGAKKLGASPVADTFFDTVTLKVNPSAGRSTPPPRVGGSQHSTGCLAWQYGAVTRVLGDMRIQMDGAYT